MSKPLNEKITDFYNANKGIIWLAVIAIILYYLFAPSMNFGSPSYDVQSERYAMQPKAMMESIAPRMSQQSAEAGYAPEEEKRIRKTAMLDMEAEKAEYEKAKGLIDSVVIANNGFYVSKNEYKSAYGDTFYKTYTATLKVPVNAFDKTLEQLKNVAEVKRLSMDASDLTTQYHDIQTDLETQKSLKKRVEALLSKAEKIEDIIKLEEKLSEYQKNIDYIQKQLLNIERQTDYSSITVVLEEKHEIKESFYEFTGLRELVRNIVRSFDSILVTFTNYIGWILVGLIVWGGYRLYHRRK